MNRGVSTVVDVTIFLLFVGAAAAALVGAAGLEPPSPGNPAAEEAELLATSTATVEYAVEPAADPPDWATDPAESRRRTAHGTLAKLLGEAAMSAVRVNGTRLSTAGTGFEAAVANRPRSRLRESGRRHAVRVRWEPYPRAPVDATTRVGDYPPPSADVHAATLTVPSPMASATDDRTGDGGYEGVAGRLASSVVNGLFPPRQAQLALDGDYPSNQLVSRRYRRMGVLVGAEGVSPDSTGARELNAELTAALAARFERDMRQRFDSPAAASASVRAGRITITVRTWSP